MSEHDAPSSGVPLPWWTRVFRVLWKISVFLEATVLLSLVVNIVATWLTSSKGVIPADAPLVGLLTKWTIVLPVSICLVLLTLLFRALGREPLQATPHTLPQEHTQGLRRMIEQQRPLVQPPVPLSMPNQQNRIRMLKQVRTIWIDGLLTHSLHHAAEIELHLQDRPDMLANPWRLQIQELDHAPQSLPDGTTIVQVFDRANGELLLLGEPGAGKTTLLLELTRSLLERAEQDEQLRLPIVFNLSSWAEQRQSLRTWLVEELRTKYHVPRKIGQEWIDADQVLPLLDGLDEVAKEARAACVQAINTYYQSRLEERRDSPLVVCCRSEEYDALSTRVTLQHAVSILPLTDEQINLYLEQAGEQVKALKQALNEDAELHSLARQPLMLNIFTLAYQGATVADVPIGKTRAEMQHLIFATYVDRMLRRRNQSKRWEPQQVIGWLMFLARQMQRHDQTVFSVENLQPAWLSRRGRFLYHACLGLFRALGMGLLVGLLAELLAGLLGHLPTVPIGGLVGGVGIGLVTGPTGVLMREVVRGLDAGGHSAEALTWSWKRAWSGLVAGLAGGLVLGLVVGLVAGVSLGLAPGLIAGSIAGLVLGLTFGLSIGLAEGLDGGLVAALIRVLDTGVHSAEELTWSWKKGLSGLVFGLTLGLVFGLVAGLIAGLASALGRAAVFGLVFSVMGGLVGLPGAGLSERRLPEHSSLSPNEGIWRSGKTGLAIGLVTGVSGGLVIGVIVGLIRGATFGLIAGLVTGLVTGLIAGVLVGLEAFVKHFLLRFFLSLRGDLPWDLVPFLDEAAGRLLLRKLGGSYIFVHRLLLDYFAALHEPMTSGRTSPMSKV